MDKIVLSFLIGSSNLQTIRTGIRSRMHMNSGLILLLTLALFRLEFGKKNLQIKRTGIKSQMRDDNGKNSVSSLACSVFIGSL